MTSIANDFTIAATGDSIITRRVLPIAERSDNFAELCSLLRETDAAVTNLEVVLPNDDTYATPMPPVPDQYQYLSSLAGILMRASPHALDELDGMGFNLFSAATNHSFDYGRPGMVSTMAALRERNLTFAGLGRNRNEAASPSYRETPGGRVALVSATTSIAPGSEAGPGSPIHPGRPGINPLHLRWRYQVRPDQLEQLRSLSKEIGIETMKDTWLVREDPDWDEREEFRFMHMAFESAEDEANGVTYEIYEHDRAAYLDAISEASRNADWIVATLHSHQGPNGTRNVPETPSFLVEFAHDCIDHGATIFIGTGPHVLRGIEIYDECPIFYSLGNFFYQTETIERLPPESFEYYGVDDMTDVSGLLAARYFDEDGNPSGNLQNEDYWRTVIPICHFEKDELVEIELYPCTLGRDRDLPHRGTPLRATGDEANDILQRLTRRSSRFDTTINRDEGIGSIVL